MTIFHHFLAETSLLVRMKNGNAMASKKLGAVPTFCTVSKNFMKSNLVLIKHVMKSTIKKTCFNQFCSISADNFRPYITSFQGNNCTDYINAVFVDVSSTQKLPPPAPQWARPKC